MTDQDKVKRLATEVMGWKLCWYPKRQGERIFDEGEWNPYANIQHAWMLVEKLDADGHEVEIGTHKNEPDKWYCLIIPNEYYISWRVEVASTAHAAIAEAALATIDSRGE